MWPQASPTPNLEVEIGYVAIRAPSPMSMSFCSFTLMMTRLGPSARRTGPRAKMVIATRASRRNMKGFLLEFSVLSRGNCRRRAFAASEIQARHPPAIRRKRDIKEPDLEHREEGHRDPLAVVDGEPEEVGKINRERHFGQRQERFQRHVLAGTPRLGFAFDAVLGRAGEIRFVIEDRLENGARIINRESYTEREQGRQKEDFFHPGARMQLPLRANVKHCDGNRRSHKNRNVEEQRADPRRLRAAGRGMEEHAQTSEEQICEVRSE